MDNKGKIITIFQSCSLSILYVSSIFLSDAISYRSDLLAVLYMIITAVIFGCIMVSPGKLIAAIKWLISLPIAYIVFQFFWRTDFAVRALNQAFPDYGKQSAGGNFAGFIRLCFMTALFLTAGLIGLFFDQKKHEISERKICVVGFTYTAIIVLVVILLESSLPQLVNG